ncbi:hypothetical protein BV898_04106 [Hypsibius exemplaris]|uniref:Protein kinase domain-containing protein n=1 Tax=Hypsibius exemplaris TaxID=2072580 RepID=A0A1W0X336_HYPEX|nr:hypothetical protein BV898_04106 [Hypsibius exemplaris]
MEFTSTSETVTLELVRQMMKKFITIRHNAFVHFIGVAVQPFSEEHAARRAPWGGCRSFEIAFLLEDYECKVQEGLAAPASVNCWIDLWRFVLRKNLSTAEVLQYAMHILDALCYLHRQDPPFVIGSIRTGIVKLAPSFTSLKILALPISAMYPDIYHCLQLLGNANVYYVYPELLALIQRGDGEKLFGPHLATFTHADLWSLGCIVLDMVTQLNLQHVDKNGILLSPHLSEEEFQAKMIAGGRPYIPEGIPTVIRQLCQRCFERNPRSQLTAEELLKFFSPELQGMIETGEVSESPPVVAYLLYPEPITAALPEKPSMRHSNVAYLRWISDIGKGGFADVYSVKIINNNDPYGVTYSYGQKPLALKMLRSTSLEESVKVVLLSLQHPNIVKYIVCGMLPIALNALTPSVKPQPGILMEYYAGGTLHDFAERGNPQEGDLIPLLGQVANGLAYLHGLGSIENKNSIFHGDIKGENIFLTEDKKSCRIGDLENHYLLKQERTITGGFRAKAGTLRHMSPEMLQHLASFGDNSPLAATNIGRASDIWSFGCVAVEVFDKGRVEYRTTDGTVVSTESSLQQVTKESPEIQFARYVSQGASPDLTHTEGAQRMGTALKEIVRKCLARIPAERPNAAQLCKDLSVVLLGNQIGKIELVYGQE